VTQYAQCRYLPGALPNPSLGPQKV
jgi:hypothetical protein